MGSGTSRFDSKGKGMPPVELWGVSQRDRKQPRKRGEASRQRRRTKQGAKWAGMSLKEFIRKYGVQ